MGRKSKKAKHLHMKFDQDLYDLMRHLVNRKAPEDPSTKFIEECVRYFVARDKLPPGCVRK